MPTDAPHYDPPHDAIPESPDMGYTTQPLAGDGGISGLGGFPNAHFSRYSAQSSLGGPGSIGMTRSESGYTDSGLIEGRQTPFADSNRGSYVPAAADSPTFANDGTFETAQAEKYAAGTSGGPGSAYAAGAGAGAGKGSSFWARKKKWIISLLVLLIIIIVVAVAVPVAISNSNSGGNNDNAVQADGSESSSSSTKAKGSSTSTASGSATSPTTVSAVAMFGSSGSKVILADGSEGPTYVNNFGGYWGYDASNPTGVNTAGRAQSWSPALNETFNYGVDKIRGVNLGGWLNTEPFIVPALYEKYASSTPTPVDEWTLSVAMGDNLATEMEEHYKTFITEDDFMQIAAAGLNFIRIPIGWWAIETYEGEPFLEGVSWQYFLKAIEWARKYGLRINLDLHAIPGSQNGWNHSGRSGNINFLHGLMGMANAQRALNYVRTLAEFVSQEEYKDVVPMFSVLNEPFAQTIGLAPIQSWYTETYDMVRGITGLGEGNGPFITFHDAFAGLSSWQGFLSGSDRVALDTHTYVCFNGQQITDALSAFPPVFCNGWGNAVNTSMDEFGLTVVGEWSLAVNDCGKWVNGVGLGTRWEGNYTGSSTVYGTCEPFTDYQSWDNDTLTGYKNIMLAQMDTYQNYFFWTWKIGNSSITGVPPNPMWSYSLGLQQGYAPTDPREATGACAAAGVVANEQFDGTFPSAWMTGGSGAGQSVSTQNAWPPSSMGTLVPAASMTEVPQFVITGAPITLPGPTYTSSVDVGNGWANPSDTASAYAKVSGCSYPDPWTDTNDAITSGECGAGTIPTALLRRDTPPPAPTPAPTPASPRR